MVPLQSPAVEDIEADVRACECANRRDLLLPRRGLATSTAADHSSLGSDRIDEVRGRTSLMAPFLAQVCRLLFWHSP